MMARDYSRVGAPGGGSTATGQGSKRPWWIAGIAALVLVVVIAVVAVSCSAGGGDSANGDKPTKTAAAGIGSPHGPSTITDGIPSGYTRDKAGAATAAVNFIQAVSQANQGRISADKLGAQSVGANPTPALSQVISQASGRAADSTVYSSMPVVTTVRSFDESSAVVAVWELDSSQSKIGTAGKVGVQTLWSTTTVTVSWSGSDWKATDWSFTPGPNPQDATFPAPDSPLAGQATGGYYSFYIN